LTLSSQYHCCRNSGPIVIIWSYNSPICDITALDITDSFWRPTRHDSRSSASSQTRSLQHYPWLHNASDHSAPTETIRSYSRTETNFAGCVECLSRGGDAHSFRSQHHRRSYLFTAKYTSYTNDGTLSSTRQVYAFDFALASITHIVSWSVSLTSLLFPARVLLPVISCEYLEWPLGIHRLLQWDNFVGSTAVLVWAAALLSSSGNGMKCYSEMIRRSSSRKLIVLSKFCSTFKFLGLVGSLDGLLAT
jgi:hypothetical protein